MIYFVLGLLVFVLAILMYGGYYMFRSVFDSHVKGEDNPDPSFTDSEGDMMRPTSARLKAFQAPLMEEFHKLPFMELEIMSFDGLKLKGYLLEGNPKEVVICVHGYKSAPDFDFCDKYKIYKDRGSTVLFVHDRAHNNSEGRYYGFSDLDRFDVAKWVDLMNKMYDSPRIYLHGVSMGGATVIHCADMKLKNVCGIVDDCGFDSILGISQALCRDIYHLPYFPLGYTSMFWSLLLNKVKYTGAVGEKCVRNTDIPIVFFHGKDDHYVPCYMSEKMYEACVSPKELHLIDDCGHAAAYMRAPEEYTDAVNRLLDGKIK